MEKKTRLPDRSLIQVILQKYRDCSVDSITGPTGLRKYDPGRVHPDDWPSTRTDGVAVKSKQEHVSSSKDRHGSTFVVARLPASGVASTQKRPTKVRRTLVDGIAIACFNVGGEKRLCFDQLVGDILKEFSLTEVNTSRDHLKIYCPRCDEYQLESLKLSDILPWSASSALLITKTDAYRLCSALLAIRAPQRQEKKYTKPYIDVYHECFGGCEGIFEPETYNEPHAKCVTCLECHRLFSPRKFVTHSHAKTEIQTCHWGMDSSKWRVYLLLPDDKAEEEATRKLWEEVKKRFAGTPLRKRKQSNSEGESLADSDSGETHSKRRVETKALSFSGSRSGTPSSSMSSPRDSHGEQNNNRRSAFRPWSPLEEKPRIAESSSSVNETTTTTNSPGHMNSRFFHPPPPPPLPFMARNCSCPISYAPLNASVNFVHSSLGKALKSEHPGVICTHGLPPSNCNGIREWSRERERVVDEEPEKGDKTHDAAETKKRVATQFDRAGVPQREHEKGTSGGESKMAAIVGGDEREKTIRNFASPERVKQVLHKYCHKGVLPSVDELSSALAKELRDWGTGQEKMLDEVNEKGERLREELKTLRRENDTKLRETHSELKSCQERLEQLNRKRDEDLKEFAKTREALQRQVESLQEQRASESETVKKLVSQLGERETRCRMLEKELDYIRSWYIGSQRRFPAFQPVALYGTGNLREVYCNQNAFIQEIPVYPCNDESPPLTNRATIEETDHDSNAKPGDSPDKKERPET